MLMLREERTKYKKDKGITSGIFLDTRVRLILKLKALQYPGLTNILKQTRN
jgi:hypothetical protein